MLYFVGFDEHFRGNRKWALAAVLAYMRRRGTVRAVKVDHSTLRPLTKVAIDASGDFEGHLVPYKKWKIRIDAHRPATLADALKAMRSLVEATPCFCDKAFLRFHLSEVERLGDARYAVSFLMWVQTVAPVGSDLWSCAARQIFNSLHNPFLNERG